MMQLQEVKLMNESMILYLKKLGRNSKRNEIISKILSDEACFFKMEKNDALLILEDIGIAKNKVDLIYSELISQNNYYYLQKIGKLKDEDLIVKYEDYKYDDLFKKKQENKNTSLVEYKESIIKKIINKIKKVLGL